MQRDNTWLDGHVSRIKRKASFYFTTGNSIITPDMSVDLICGCNANHMKQKLCMDRFIINFAMILINGAILHAFDALYVDIRRSHLYTQSMKPVYRNIESSLILMTPISNKIKCLKRLLLLPWAKELRDIKIFNLSRKLCYHKLQLFPAFRDPSSFHVGH